MAASKKGGLPQINTLSLLKKIGKAIFANEQKLSSGYQDSTAFEKSYLGTNENTGENIRGNNYRFGSLPNDEWINLISSNLKAMKYNFATELLTVKFLNNSEYEYYGVSPDVAMQLFRSISHGSFFYYNIRTSYVFNKIA